jgi:hypothetical protein
MEVEALEDHILVAIAFCGLFFVTIITIYIFSVAKLPNIDGNDAPVEEDDDGERKIPKKERDPAIKKEKLRVARLRAKADIQSYKESCQKSQMQNRRNEVNSADVSIVSLDRVLDMLADQSKVGSCRIDVSVEAFSCYPS